MKREQRYGVRSLEKEFPTEEACLNFIFDAQHSRQCSCGGTYKLIKGRRQFQCSKCRFQIAPTAGTIFHKSDTPLVLWFKAILAFSNAKSGISAKEMERQLEVTYKTAWRILMLIRKALGQKGRKLKGDVETDTAYFGGRFKSGRYNEKQKEAIAAKAVVMGAIQRGGKARLLVVPDATAKTHGEFLKKNIATEDTRLMTDKSNIFSKSASQYDRHTVNHGKKEYVRGDVYINTVEGFFGHVKKSIAGTHKSVSKKHLQAYLNGFVWLRNNSYSDKARFASLLGSVLLGAR